MQELLILRCPSFQSKVPSIGEPIGISPEGPEGIRGQGQAEGSKGGIPYLVAREIELLEGCLADLIKEDLHGTSHLVAGVASN